MACFSPDGRRVLTLSSSITDSSNYDHAWWLATDKGPRPEVDPGVQHRRGVFFPGGDSHMSFSTTGEAKIVRIWDAETGAEVAALTKKRPGLFEFGHVWHPTRAAFSPNGRHVVVAFAEGVAAVWNAVTGGDEEVLLQGQDGAVQAAVFSPDGRRLATAGADRTVRMWDAATGKELPQLRGHQGAVRLVRFHPNGKLLLTTSEDRTARVWNVETGDEKAVFRGHTAEVRDASFSPDGRHVVTAGDTTARLWSVAPAPELGLVLKAHTAALSALAFSPDGKRLLTASRDGTVKLCDAATGRELLVLGKGQDLGPVRSAGFSADGRSVITAAETYLTALGDGRTGNASPVHLWDARTGKDRLALPGHETGASVATLSPDGRRLLTISEGHKRWKTGFATGSRSDSRWAGVVRLWDPATNRLVATLPGKGSSECVPMFSHDGRRLLVAFDNPTASRLFDAATGKELRAFSPAEQRWGRMVAVLSPDGQRVLTWTAGDNQTYTWDAQTGRLLARPQLLEAAVAFACFSPDSRRFAALAGRNAYVCDARTGQRVAVLRGHQAAAITAVFGPEGQRLLTGSADRTAVLWDVATSKVLALYKGHSGAVGLVAFSPSGRQIATGSTDGSVRLWPTDLLSAVLPRRPRELTEAEHERYEIPAPVVRKNGRAR
jgi:WD40 repeat protein